MSSSHKKSAPIQFPLSKIEWATNNFAEGNIIGQGGYGKVYKGDLYLSWKPTKIVARRLHRDYGQGDLEFLHETAMFESLNLKHDNLVSIIGFCDERGEKIIIYKHEVNGSLDKFLSSPTLTWMQRLQISVDVARALNYIYCDNGHDFSVIHRNIKSSKILLDENWKPKLSGFGHFKTNTKDRRHRLVLADIVGTIGYADPTYVKTGFVTHKSDVYSFGVVLFEIICGRRAFVPDETEEHSPQYFNEQDYKESLLLTEKELLSFDREKPLFDGPPSFTPLFGREQVTSFVDRVASSFGAVSRSSYVGVSRSSMDYRHPEPTPTGNVNVPVQPEKNYSLKDQHFRLHPLFTMKRLDQYLHSPKEELLAQMAKSHYEEDNLKDIIDPDIWKQMSPDSFKLFSETAYNCLKDKRAERPTIDQILRSLNKALSLQTNYENPGHPVVVSGEEDKGTTSANRLNERDLNHLKLPITNIEAATKKGTYLGQGTFATVYKAELEVQIKDKTTGEISREWRTVAIKCIKDIQNAKEGFNAEIELLTSCEHPNIVMLLGFCNEGSNMILVYEHASNKSLADYLGITDTSTNLTWMQRIKIGIDIANGLNYIHNLVEDEQKRIIHRDIKSENILMGKNWAAKIADFGLSRFYIADKLEKTVLTNNVAGTNYYLCPEYKKYRKLKTAVDIYSFGVVLFEIVSGKLAYDPVYDEGGKEGIAEAARRHFKAGAIYEMVDPKLMDEVDELTSTLHKGPNQNSLKTYLEIAHSCVAVTQNDRPTAKKVVDELLKASSLQENNNDNLQMPFEKIKLATQNFNLENRIGGGGFGDVFKGEVTRDNGSTTIVAKRLDRRGRQGDHQFLMELEILFEYKHENIIGLEGYCNEKNEKIIVYEHASNISLDRYLSDANLTWTKRLKICIDIARGLAFLHGGSPTKEMVIHRDIKSANILLKDDWKAKISDFGLSAITAINQKVVSQLVGTDGYLDPQYAETGFFTERSDIYSFGVVLFEILNGKLLVPKKDYDEKGVASFLAQIHEKEKLGLIVFEGIEKQIDPKSLSTFRVIVSQCLAHEREERPTANEVLQQLQKSLEFQEERDIWGPKLPEDYVEILKLSTYSENYSTKMKKELYNVFCEGILLQDGKLWFSRGSNDERNELISATTFSYRNCSPHDKWCIISESRFQKVAKMLDISNLMINIETKTQFLSPDTQYGVHLVFKFCDSKNLSRDPMYVDLKYRKGSKTMHAYFAKWRDDKWMMIELYRFLNQKEQVVFKFLLESLSHCRDDAIYIEGIEFRVIDNVGHDETEKPKEIKQIMKSTLINVGQDMQLPIESEEIYKRSENYDDGEKMFALSEVNGKKHLMLSAKATLLNFSNLKLFKPLTDSRFQEVFELLPQQIFRISCTIKSQMFSQDTEYLCYLVFKLSKKCHELHCPVEVRDLLHKNKAAEIVYFRTPKPWNIHDITRVPIQRKDGWMEVNLWKLNSNHELKNDCVLVNLKLISYEGSMSGLIVCGIEFRPM